MVKNYSFGLVASDPKERDEYLHVRYRRKEKYFDVWLAGKEVRGDLKVRAFTSTGQSA